jgi:membrane protein implicated in regulation of membrane protease activity
MAWWLWILLGLGLLFLELATPGSFVAFFFGLSGVVVGVVTALGWAGPEWVQWLLFSALAIIMLALLRGPLHARLNLKGSARPVDSLVGECGVILDEIPDGGVGKVEVRGSSWSARAAQALQKGRRCRVDRVDGLTLWVRPE